jgi:hypothetical protein
MILDTGLKISDEKSSDEVFPTAALYGPGGTSLAVSL